VAAQGTIGGRVVGAVPDRSRNGGAASGFRRWVIRKALADDNNMETKVMTKLFTALAVAGGLALAGSAANAAPISKPVLDVQSLFTPAQYYGGYGGYRRPYCYYVRRCGYNYGYYQCWRERVCN
jgi:hypothetical protein